MNTRFRAGLSEISLGIYRYYNNFDVGANSIFGITFKEQDYCEGEAFRTFCCSVILNLWGYSEIGKHFSFGVCGIIYFLSFVFLLLLNVIFEWWQLFWIWTKIAWKIFVNLHFVCNDISSNITILKIKIMMWMYSISRLNVHVRIREVLRLIWLV